MGFASPEGWTDARIQEVEKRWNLSEKQKTDLIELGKRLEGVDWQTDLNEGGRNDPSFLVRYLVGGKSVDEAEKRFRKLTEWAEETDIANIKRDFTPPQEFLDYMPVGFLQGVDKEGDPILVRRLPDIGSLLKKYPFDVLYKYSLYFNISEESMETYEKEHGRLFRSLTFIEDMKGMSTMHCSRESLSLYSRIITTQQDLCPEFSKKIIVVNAPRVFYFAFQIVKIFLKQRVRDKIIICSSEQMTRKVLSKYVDTSVLPPQVLPEGKGKPLLSHPKSFAAGRFAPENGSS